jgi:cell division protein FtsQ
VAGEPRIPARADAAVAVLPRPAERRRLDLARLLPSGRAVLVTLVVVALAAGVYLVARETALFGIRTVEVTGAPPDVAARVRSALRPFMGASLVTLDGGRVERALSELPVVAYASYDRDFPHTLRVFVRAERPVAVVRRGPSSWLVSARGRVMEELDLGAQRDLPRVWVKGSVQIAVGATVSGDTRRAVAAVSPLAQSLLARRVATVRVGPEELTLALRSGLELRLGDLRNLRLKLAVGARIAHTLGAVSGYVDLAVPGRPVSTTNPKPGD